MIVDSTLFAAVCVAAYLLGALPFAVLFARAFGMPDPRTYGSGNPGATNMARAGRKTPAALTLLADFGKGFLPLWALHVWTENAELFAAAGAAAVFGHVFSPFLRFRGGKGVATALGVFFAWYWPAGIVAAAVWGAVFLLCRISAVASITAITAAVAVLVATTAPPVAFASVAVGLLIVFRHRENITAIRRGRRFGGGGAFARRMCRAAVVVAGILWVAATVHDYPATRNQINLIRTGNEIAAQRPWIATFHFLNEMGGGIKFFLTGNEKYMRHYPSISHLEALKFARAKRGDWRAQLELARRHHFGEDGAPKDNAATKQWLRRAANNAPAEIRPEIEKIIQTVENSGYSSASHMQALRIVRAENGGWAAQLELARRHHFGEGGAAQDNAAAKLWLRRAANNAPAEVRPKIEKIIQTVEAENAPPSNAPPFLDF